MKSDEMNNRPNVLRAFLHPINNPTGRRSSLSTLEEDIIVEKMFLAVSHGFAIALIQLQEVAGKVESEQ